MFPKPLRAVVMGPLELMGPWQQGMEALQVVTRTYACGIYRNRAYGKNEIINIEFVKCVEPTETEEVQWNELSY